jgi:hypothetical protein
LLLKPLMNFLPLSLIRYIITPNDIMKKDPDTT